MSAIYRFRTPAAVGPGRTCLAGLLDAIYVHPQEVFKSAIATRAAAVVLVHNQPNGDPTPCEADVEAARDLIRAGQPLKIEVLGHALFR